jgi:signal transduction histidine kinase/ActR/RegA family two-component response regulator
LSLLEKHQTYTWSPQLIKEASNRIIQLVLSNHDQPIKVWMAGGHEKNILNLLEQLSASPYTATLSKNLKIQLTTHTQNQVERLKESTRQLRQQSGGGYSSPIQSLWRNCVFHSRHNILTDAPYRNMSLILMPWIFGALKPVYARSLATALAASQVRNGNLLVAPEEKEILAKSSYLKQEHSDFLLRQDEIKRARNTPQTFLSPPNLDDELGKQVQLRLNPKRQIVTVKGNTTLFLSNSPNEPNAIIGRDVSKTLRSDLITSLAEMLSHNIGHVPRKKLIILKDQVVLATIQTQIYNQHPCDFVSLEIVEDMELQVPQDGLEPGHEIVQSTKAIAQEKSRAFDALERLSLKLAADNDLLQSKIEPLRQEMEELRQQNHELSNSVKDTQEQYELQKDITSHTRIALAICDPEGRLVFRNQQFLDILGVNEATHLTDRALGLPIDEVIPLLSDCFAGGVAGQIEFLERSSGNQYHLYARPLSIPRQLAILEILPATTQPARLDFMQSLQQIKISTVILTHDFNIDYLDSTVATWHQSEPTQLLHRPFRSLIHPQYHAELEVAINDAHQNPMDIEVPLLRRDGETTWVRVRSFVADSNSPIILLIENIRLRKQDEKQSKITQKLELLGQITGGVAHDFNNILAIMVGYIDLMRSDFEELDAADTKRYLEQMKDASERARTLVKQLLLYSRGDKKQSITTQNIAAGIKETLPLIKTSLQDHIYLTTNLAAEDIYIEMDPAHLHQILMNLSINARDAVDEVKDREGEIIIGLHHAQPLEEIECASCRSKLGLAEQHQYVILSVTDNGPGIPDNTIDQMFDPFFSTKSANKGSGMGLSVVHGLVHQYGGHLQVLNSNYGVQFRAWLPKVKAVQSALATVEPISKLPKVQFHWRALVVEDDPNVATVITKLLGFLEIEVVHCENGLSALKHLQQDQNFDLVLSDQNMPVMTGTELASTCQELLPDIPFILMSGNSLNIDEHPMPDNVVHIMDKPVTTQELTNAIQSIATQSANTDSRSEAH